MSWQPKLPPAEARFSSLPWAGPTASRHEPGSLPTCVVIACAAGCRYTCTCARPLRRGCCARNRSFGRAVGSRVRCRSRAGPRLDAAASLRDHGPGPQPDPGLGPGQWGQSRPSRRVDAEMLAMATPERFAAIPARVTDGPAADRDMARDIRPNGPQPSRQGSHLVPCRTGRPVCWYAHGLVRWSADVRICRCE